MMKRHTFWLIIFSFIATTSSAQLINNSIEVSPFVGLQMFSADGNTIKGTSWGTEAVYHINMANNEALWAKQLHVRDVSIAFSYRNLQNNYLSKISGTKGFLGNYYGLISRVSIPVFTAGQTELLFTPGFGFGYATQTFYTNDNPLVGSHINFTAQVGLKLSTPISPATRLVGGIDLYHYSNAAFKLPNDGVNSINASLGIQQNINQPAPPTSKNPFTNYNKHSFEFGVDIGKRGVVQVGGGLGAHNEEQRNATSRLYQSGLYAGYNYRVNPVLSLRAGLDAVYYFTTLDTISDIKHFYATYQELGSSYDRWRLGTSIGAELWMGKVSFPVNLGYYLHYHYFIPTNDHTYYPPNFYWSFGARYYFTPFLAIEAKQYLHRTQADFAGFGLLFKIH